MLARSARVCTPDVDENDSWYSTWPGGEGFGVLKNKLSADVIIIGAGFTGLSTAWALHHRFPDRRVVVLEAKTIGTGASGRNGGMMLNWMNGVSRDTEALARVNYDTTAYGIRQIVRKITEYKLDVPYNQIGCLELFTDTRRAEEGEEEVQRLNRWGIPVQWIGREELKKHVRAEGAVGAILDPGTGHLHGLALLRAQARYLRGKVDIFEHSAVLKIEEGRNHRVVTAEGEVVAPALVLATNGYTPRLGYFKHSVFPMHSHVIATEPLSPAAWERLGWSGSAGFSDDLDRIAYGGMSSTGALIFGGGGNFAYGYRYNNGTTFPRTKAVASFDAIHKKLLHYFPQARDLKITHRWSGTLGVTLDRGPAMGVRGEHRNVYYALGYSGHGVTLANLAGEVLCDLYSGAEERWKDKPFYHRRLYPMPGEPLRWLGYHVVTGLTGKSPRRRS